MRRLKANLKGSWVLLSTFFLAFILMGAELPQTGDEKICYGQGVMLRL